jgi:microcystin-dependent protein
MKKSCLILAFLCISVNYYAQGIAIQGIARDNASSAIADTNLTFTFSITKEDNTVLYAETQSIQTDNYGVFSHIVKNGNPLNSTVFSLIDFSIQNLKMIVSVDYDGNTIDVYNQPFQYTPYAHFAANGVPTGSIMPYMGTEAPVGWVFCDGQSLTSITGSAALIALIGNDAPDLQGTFLRGTGVSTTNKESGPELGSFQGDAYAFHRHGRGSLITTSNGVHNHTVTIRKHNRSFVGENSTGAPYQDAGAVTGYLPTDSKGNHSHTVTGYTAYEGGNIKETRPVNYGVNYIIKL